MSEFLKKLEPTDFIAVIFVVGGFYLKLQGANGEVSTIIALIAGYYFGKKSYAFTTKTIDKKLLEGSQGTQP